MKMTLRLTLLIALLLLWCAPILNAQCQPDETEVRLIIETDTYGYETFWSLAPTGNACNQTPIATGGNTNQVGCNGGGQQDATTAFGYKYRTNLFQATHRFVLICLASRTGIISYRLPTRKAAAPSACCCRAGSRQPDCRQAIFFKNSILNNPCYIPLFSKNTACWQS